MNKAERRASGAHYTTEKNIMKVIQPLFLDDLRAEFERLNARRDTGRRNACSRSMKSSVSCVSLIRPAGAATSLSLPTANCESWKLSC